MLLAVLCCAVLCCAALCCAVLCYAMLCSALPRCALPYVCHAVPCFVLMLCFVLQAFKGDYKWILYGDDDTFFFVDGVLELLQDFDHSLPYFITGMCSAQILCASK